MTNKNKIINQAQKFIQKGQWDKAIKELQKLVAEDPSDVRTLLKLGDVFAKKGDRDQATKVYKQVAASYGEQGFFLKAVAVYKQILKHDPGHLEVTLKLAELYEHLGLTSEAMVQYQIAAQMHDEAGNVRETLDVLKRMVDLDGDNVASRIKLAENFSRENRIPEAIDQFMRAAEILKQHNRIEDYIKVTERLVYHDPNRLDVIKELAKIYLERNDTKRGLAKLQMCFKAAPRDVETLTLLSGAFRELGQLQKTVFVLRELARIHQENGNETESRTVAQKILEIDPNDADARAALGYPTAPGARPANFGAGGGLNSAQVFGGSTGMMPGFSGTSAIGNTGMMPAFSGTPASGNSAYAASASPYPAPAQPFGVTTGGMAAHPAPSSFGASTGNQPAYDAAGGFGTVTGSQLAHGAPPSYGATAPSHVAGYPPGPTANYHPPQMGAPGFGVGTGNLPAQPFGSAPVSSFGQGTPAPGFSAPPGGGFGVATGLGTSLPTPNATPRRRAFEDPSEAAAGYSSTQPENPQVTKILTETDVYIKYGLRDKAIEHLRRVFEIDADSATAYGKLRDIYASAGDLARAAEMVGNIIHIHSRRGDAEALEAARADLMNLAPGHPLISGVQMHLEGDPVTENSEEFDSIDITEASDTYDARELRAAHAHHPHHAPVAPPEPEPVEDDAVDAWLQQDPGFDELGDDEAASAEGEGVFADEDVPAPHQHPGLQAPSRPAMTFGTFDHEVSSVSVAEADIVEAVESAHDFEPLDSDGDLDGGYAAEDADPFGMGGVESAMTGSHAVAAPTAHPPFQDLGLPTEEEANELPEAASGIIMLEGVSYADELLAPPPMGTPLPNVYEPMEATAEDVGQFGGLGGIDRGSPPTGSSVAPDLGAAQGLDAVPWYDSLSAADPEEEAVGSEPLSFQSPIVEAPRPEGALSEEDAQKIEDELDEAEFLAGEGLRDEPLDAIASVLARVTGHPRAIALRALIESGALGGDDEEDEGEEAAAPVSPAASAEAELGGASDAEWGGAAADFAAGMDFTPHESRDLPDNEASDTQSFGNVSDDELADAFDLGGDPGDGTNPEDHYDEAMAYKELNRIDDAIAHFRLAAKSPSRAIPALEMIGHCLLAKSDYEGAIQSFYAAMERGVEGPAAVNLKFEIAAAYEAAGDGEQAVNWFRSCYADDPNHRDVRGRLSALGIDPSEAETPNPHMNGAAPPPEPEHQERPVAKKSKISYL